MSGFAPNSAKKIGFDDIILAQGRDISRKLNQLRMENYLTLTALTASTCVPITVHPQMLDLMSMSQLARDLSRKARAVVRQLDEQAYVISQGQENSGRANLSFIGRALFADRFEKLAYAREVIQAAFSVDYQTLSKMLAVLSAFGERLIESIGPAKGVGRARWLQLRKLIDVPKNKLLAEEFTQESGFRSLPQTERFDAMFKWLRSGKETTTVKRSENTQPRQLWKAKDNAFSVSQKATSKAMMIVLSASNGVAFGDWITKNIESYCQTFQQQGKTEITTRKRKRPPIDNCRGSLSQLVAS
ncbi:MULTISPECIES: plasmid partitioning protein RepB C-terminal domain-containing protein [Rhizobium/Agrobacterium group]|uniref:plasmid partitioning protein RepB C-terminal domain-containing protein n=1 Tax=Rhizobium/Agrobacterium group TaxID=227290 RepID=UPI001AD9FCA5|nr:MULTISPECIES: plasmid partitioning protein RepB C-terminal domain-containing protein [Rhizobium/Agrobacterium group]MBO9112519.1 hypothetical protein [Agrobacterium sp. S2/73]QXZ76025.1 hypothetical protein J5276_28545 [Agrobacterium sp. S7/73]QYA16964.1 hypothetical protein J5284_32960 [Rhizobium sp. AB2/73]UEQ85463.1 hypothetical protein I8E17_31100 [Rhizobium sp. AB2/73]